MNEHLGIRIKSLRKTLKLNQREFSEAISVSHATISHIENGKTSLDLRDLDKIIKAFPKVNKYWLLDGDGFMFKKQDNSYFSQKASQNINTPEQNNEIKGGQNQDNSLQIELLSIENTYLKETLQIKEKQIESLKKPSVHVPVSVTANRQISMF